MDKAQRERLAVASIYDEAEFPVYIHQDRPDFVLGFATDGPRFGVEVTELFQSEANARLLHVPDYVTRLFEGEPHMHKDDVSILNVVRVAIHDKDGNLKQSDVPAVIQETPPPIVHREAVAEAIRGKDAKIVHYEVGLSHINLVIVDYFEASFDPSQPYSVGDLLIPALRAALEATAFREVFLVSRDSSGTLYYRPLQLIWLLERFLLFRHALVERLGPDAIRSLPDAEVVPLFVSTLNAQGHAVYYSARSGCAVYRGNGVRHGTDGGIEILDYHDRTLPPPDPLPPLSLDQETLGSLVNHYETFAATNSASVGVAIMGRAPGQTDV